MTKGFTFLFYLLVMVNSNLGHDDTTNREKQLMPPVLEYGPDNEVYTYYDDSVVSLPCLAKGQEMSKEKTRWVSWWTKNGKNFTSDNTLKIGNAQRNDTGRYQCFVSNGVGVAMSNSTEVRYIEIPKNSTQKRSLHATEGQPFILACELPQDLVNDENNYWIRKTRTGTNQPQENFKEPQIILMPNGSLWFLSVTQRDDTKSNSGPFGNYFYFISGRKQQICETELIVKNSSKEVIPDTNPTRRFVSPRNLITKKGARVKLFCIYGGNPFPVISWKKDGVELESKDNTYVEESRSVVIINSFRPEDVGNYTCIVHKNDTTIFAENEFTVKIGKPFFIKTPREQNTTVSGSAEFHCEAAEGDSQFGLNLTWIFNGKPIAECPFNEDYIIDSQYGKSTLRIDDVKDIHVGNYGCNASNTHGYVYKEAYLFTKPGEPLRITGELNQTVEAKLDEPFKWTCPVDGVPSPNVTFMKGDEGITSGDRYTFSDGGKTLIISNFSSNDFGKYNCIAINKVTPDPVSVEINVIFPRDSKPEPKPESEFNWLAVILIIFAVLLAVGVIVAWLIYDKRYRVDGKYEVKKRENAAAQNPRIMDEANETLMPAPNAATLNRVRRTNESTREGSGNSRNGSVAVKMEPRA